MLEEVEAGWMRLESTRLEIGKNAEERLLKRCWLKMKHRGIWTGPKIRGSPWQRLRLGEASNNKHSGRKIRGKRNVLRNFVSLLRTYLFHTQIYTLSLYIYVYIYTGIVDSSTRRWTKNCSANFVSLSPVIHDEKFTLDVASITRKRGGWGKGGGMEGEILFVDSS